MSLQSIRELGYVSYQPCIQKDARLGEKQSKFMLQTLPPAEGLAQIRPVWPRRMSQFELRIEMSYSTPETFKLDFEDCLPPIGHTQIFFDRKARRTMIRRLSLNAALSALILWHALHVYAQDNTTGVQGKVYQVTLDLPHTAPELAGATCTLKFPPVPRGKKLTVSYVSLRYTSFSIILDAALTNGETGTELQEIELPGAQSIGVGVQGYTTSRYSGPVTFTIEAGGTPTMTFYCLGSDSGYGGAIATVVGTLASE